MDTRMIHPEVREVQDHPHACLGGFVYLTYVVEEEEGDEVERIEAIPCRRCREDREVSVDRS